MVALGETITVVNRSGKVVGTSKHIVNVFREAKSAYRERKAEIKAIRNHEYAEHKARKALENMNVNDNDDDDDERLSNASSHRSRGRDGGSGRSPRSRPPVERGFTDSFYANDDLPRQGRSNELVRRHTEALARIPDGGRPQSQRSASMSEVEEGLCYGDLPPPLPERPRAEELELRTKMTALQQMLDEANCVQHTVLATIENLQKNPDALAAVALTLGEISTLVAKLSPGVLTALKGAFPAAIALLISPQFMIAAGVGVGVTVVMLGGYKIIKRIREGAPKALEGPAPNAVPALEAAPSEVSEEFDELREINNDLSRIEMWRRGIADVEAHSLGTSVDGEFITPGAHKSLVAEGVLREEDLKAKSTTSSRSRKTRGGRSERERGRERSPGAVGGEKVKSHKKKKKQKEPSGLRMLFKTR